MSELNNATLLRNRINNNVLKVKDEPSEVKSILSLGLQSAKHDADFSIVHDLNLAASCTSRKELLHVSMLLATSRNTVAQENIMNVISIKLGRIKDKDYKYIANLIYLKDDETVLRVNNYLSNNLEGFDEMHKKYRKNYYAF